MRMYARLLPLAPILLLAGCIDIGDFGDYDAYKEDFHHVYPLNSGGTVSVETFNGSIEISGWEQDSVEVNATKYSRTKWAVDEIHVDVNALPTAVRVRASKPAEMFRGGGARFTIRVPRHTTLDLISTSNGHVRIEDIEGNVQLKTSNGAIRITRLKGDLEARTSNGAIEADYVEGNAKLHTSNGSVRAEIAHGLCDATTSNGSINVRLSNAAAGWPMHLESSNGHIELRVEGTQVPEVRASTSNSSIIVYLANNANAEVRARTSHSSVYSDFDGVRTDNHRGRGEMEGRIGSGGRLLDLSSSNGSIKVLKI